MSTTLMTSRRWMARATSVQLSESRCGKVRWNWSTCSGRQVVVSDEADHVAVHLVDEREPRVAEANRVAHDRVEDRLGLGGGGAHDAQHVGGRGLLLERAGEIVVSGVGLRKEPGVLLCDPRLF